MLEAQPCSGPLPPTCMLQMRTPRQAEVLCAHFVTWRAFFSSGVSSPCCRAPIFRSRTQGCVSCDTTLSSSRNPAHAKLGRVRARRHCPSKLVEAAGRCSPLQTSRPPWRELQGDAWQAARTRPLTEGRV